MFKKFSFWVVTLLLVLIGSVAVIHWETLRGFHQRVTRVQPLYERLKVISQLNLSIERYRHASSIFRKLEPTEINHIKEKLRKNFSQGIAALEQLEPTPSEQASLKTLNEQLNDFFSLITRVEPMLYNKDAYLKPDVVAQHEAILETISNLLESNDSRMAALQLDPARVERQSVVLLLAVGIGILILVLAMIVRNQWLHMGPLKKLHKFAALFRSGEGITQVPPGLRGMYGEIESALVRLATQVENHMRDRHKFLLDIVADLKSPLLLLQEGKYLLEPPSKQVNEEKQHQAAESIRKGLAIVSGSLDDLNDIVDINRMEARLEEKTVDLSELVTDVTRKLTGITRSKKISVTVPPIPVWASVDVRRIERALIHVLCKVLNTIPENGNLSISISQTTQNGFRGVELMIQDTDRTKVGRVVAGGPEQDIMKHWISENGLSMALVHKIIRAHGGSISAAGVAGTSVTVLIRFPQERVVSRGLIAPPVEGAVSAESVGLVTHSLASRSQVSADLT